MLYKIEAIHHAWNRTTGILNITSLPNCMLFGSGGGGGVTGEPRGNPHEHRENLQNSLKR